MGFRAFSRAFTFATLAATACTPRRVEGEGRLVSVPDLRDEGEAATLLPAGAPRVHVRPVGPVMIRITVDDAGKRGPIDVERRVLAGGPPQRSTVAPEPREHVHAARAGTTYAYRARLTDGEWSKEVNVRTPEPRRAPVAPTDAKAEAKDPFAVRLSWAADSSKVAGFEIEIVQGGAAVRAGVVDAATHEFTHNLRLPKQAYEYRIRAFNAHGTSEPVKVTVTTPNESSIPANTTALSPCVKLPPDHEPRDGMSRFAINDEPVLYSEPAGGMTRRLLAEYRGCLREVAISEQQSPEVHAVRDYLNEGFPLIHAFMAGGPYAGWQFWTLWFSNGHYQMMNSAIFCGDPFPDPSPDDPTVGNEQGAITTWIPPFPDCQRGSDLRSVLHLDR